MKLREKYDWIVMGDHPGALLSGCLAARLGLSVLMLDLGPSAPAAAAPDGERVLDPEASFVAGLGATANGSGLLSDLLAGLGVSAEEHGRLIRKSAAKLQAATPGARVELDRDVERLAKALRREYGARASWTDALEAALRQGNSEVIEYWRKLPDRLATGKPGAPPPSALTGLSELRRKLNRGAAPEGAEEFSRAVWQGAHGVEISRKGGKRGEPGLGDVAHALLLAQSGAGIRGGITAYRAFLRSLATKLGAHVQEGVACRRIFVSNGRFVGVQASSNQGNRIDGGAGILGSSLVHAAECISESGKNLMKRLRVAPEPCGWKFTLGLSVHEEAIPPGMSDRVIWQDGGAPTLELETATPSDYGVVRAKAGERLLFVRSTLPFDEASLQVEFQKRVAARMLRQATRLLPFLEYHIMRMYPDFRLGNADAEMGRTFAFSNLDMIPESLRVYAGDPASTGSASAGVQALFCATGEAYPELGSLGPTVAALEAVAWQARQSGLPGPLAIAAQSA